VKKLKEKFNKFQAWLKDSPKDVLITALAFLLVVIGLILFIEFVLPTLGIVILLYILKES